MVKSEFQTKNIGTLLNDVTGGLNVERSKKAGEEREEMKCLLRKRQWAITSPRLWRILDGCPDVNVNKQRDVIYVNINTNI
ncbi:hypothetical protein J6590_002705 [Homalodisca vitripennis]|nr:hypothetical protein J6590_002705 [Homalodisca vitripennis]